MVRIIVLSLFMAGSLVTVSHCKQPSKQSKSMLQKISNPHAQKLIDAVNKEQNIDHAMKELADHVSHYVPSTVFSKETQKKIENDLYQYLKRNLSSVAVILRVDREIKNYRQRYGKFLQTRSYEIVNKIFHRAKDLLLNGDAPGINLYDSNSAKSLKTLSPTTQNLLNHINFLQLAETMHASFDAQAGPYLKPEIIAKGHAIIDHLPNIFDVIVINECTPEDLEALRALQSLSIFQELTLNQYQEILFLIINAIMPSQAGYLRGVISENISHYKKLAASYLQ